MINIKHVWQSSWLADYVKNLNNTIFLDTVDVILNLKPLSSKPNNWNRKQCTSVSFYPIKSRLWIPVFKLWRISYTYLYFWSSGLSSGDSWCFSWLCNCWCWPFPGHCWSEVFQTLCTYNHDIILRWPCVMDRTLKSKNLRNSCYRSVPICTRIDDHDLISRSYACYRGTGQKFYFSDKFLPSLVQICM